MKKILKESKCIGILGGTFNPVHKGHIMLAESAKCQYDDIEHIIVMPNNAPAYKAKDSIITSKHRINMLKLAFANSTYASVSDLEIIRGGLTYTYDTLCQLREINSKLKIYFIIGADSMYSFEKWFRYQDVLKMCTLLVATRECKFGELEAYVKNFVDKYPFVKIEFLKTDNIDISSSEIRDNIDDTKVTVHIPENVLDYIKKNNLYGWNS